MMDIMRTLLEISAYAAAIFIAILLFRVLLKKRLSPLLKYALWFVLIARLLLPVTLETGVRFFTSSGTVETGASAIVSPTTDTTEPAPGGSAAAANAADTALVTQADSAPAAHTADLWRIATIVWLSGALATGCWIALSYAVLRRTIRRNAAEPTEHLQALFAETKAELGIRSSVRLACAYTCGAPAMVFPRILYLPLGALVSMRDAELRNVLRHELTHQKSCDPAVSVLLAILCAVYWFHPVVWISARMMRADMEAACDAAVTRRFSREEKEGYASLLLSLYALPGIGAPALGLSGRGVARQAEKRVRGVFLVKRSGIAAKAAALALSLALLFGCFTTACQPLSGTAGHETSRENPWISDVPVKVVARVEKEAEEFQDNLTFTVKADVTEPVDYKPETVSIAQKKVDYAAFQAMLNAAMPEVDWTTQNEPDTGMTAYGERNGDPYTAIGGTFTDGPTYFAIYPKDINIIREGYFPNDIEMEQIYAEEIHKPIQTTAAQARPRADAVIAAMGMDGLMLQGAERACRFDTQVMDDTTVLSRGWCFIYVPSCGGLPATYRMGGASYGGAFGTKYYGMPLEPVVSVYVDEIGVAMVDARDLFTVTARSEESKPLLGYENALDKARQLLKNRYMLQDFSVRTEITVTAIQLAASCVSGGTMSESEALDYNGESGNVVPVWEVVCTMYGGGVYYETFVLRFNATDGIALSQQE